MRFVLLVGNWTFDRGDLGSGTSWERFSSMHVPCQRSAESSHFAIDVPLTLSGTGLAAGKVHGIVSRRVSIGGHLYDTRQFTFLPFCSFLQFREPELRSDIAPRFSLITFLNVTGCDRSHKNRYSTQVCAGLNRGRR